MTDGLTNSGRQRVNGFDGYYMIRAN